MDIAAVDVLVIEDDMPIQRLLKHLVARLGFDCECAGDGVDGLAAIRKRDPRVIILDLLLPRANGFEVLRQLHDHTPEILARVIIVTAASPSTYAGCKEIGMTRALIRKPLDLERLCSEITACHGATAPSTRNA
ncbi:MAG TPA: response regulator [Thermoanaerobaculia bacterium]|jgi:DNA-binding response OmpR family regulator